MIALGWLLLTGAARSSGGSSVERLVARRRPSARRWHATTPPFAAANLTIDTFADRFLGRGRA